jgi:hypothetical protein
VCDAGPFFQSSFLNVIKDYAGNGISIEDYQKIETGKNRRSSHRLDDEMREYNLLENKLLSWAMTQLATGFKELKIDLQRSQWYGPGQVAQAWLSGESNGHGKRIPRVPRHKDSRIPDEVQAIARKTYYGGWFEIMAHGILPGVTYEYDINSAYPYVMSRLPCFEHGEWIHHYGGTPHKIGKQMRYRMCHVTVTGKMLANTGPLPYRAKDGSIIRPLNVSGWYWQHEIEAAQRAGLVRTVEYGEWWEYKECKCSPPLANMAGMYNKRLEIGKNTPLGKGTKVVLSSVYGKFAQYKGNEPPFQNPLYASLTTAGCRTMILDAIATHPERGKSVAMVATDGVYFRTPHPTLSLSARLGDWEMSEKINLTLLMPGVYWDDKSKKKYRETKEIKIKSRGINPKNIWRKQQEIDREFESWHEGYTPFPKKNFPLDMSMTTAYQAIRSLRKWDKCGEIRGDVTRNIDTDPSSKRDPSIRWDEQFKMWRSYPYSHGRDGLETTPYNPEHSQLTGVNSEMDGVSPDGPLAGLLAETLGMNGNASDDDT